jgi:hypothetical protein
MSLFRTLAPLRSVVARPQHLLARAAPGASQHRFQSSLASGAEGEEGEFAPEIVEVVFESSAPTYMTTLTFSEKGVQAMLKQDIDREKVRGRRTLHTQRALGFSFGNNTYRGGIVGGARRARA